MNKGEIRELVRNILSSAFNINDRHNITILGKNCYIAFKNKDDANRVAKMAKTYLRKKYGYYEVVFPYKKVFTEMKVLK